MPNSSFSSDATTSPTTLTSEVLIVGAGPAGAAAAYYAATHGYDTLVIDMADHAVTPRDKTCGDGLTPRAVGALQRMGAAHILAGRPHIRGLRLHGFGGSVAAPWPKAAGQVGARGGAFPARGSAIPRTELDAALLRHAIQAGARFMGGAKAQAVEETPSGHLAVTLQDGRQLRGEFLLLAEGVRSTLARQLGVQWLRGLVHGVAARSYVDTPYGDEPWIHSHLELRDAHGETQPGYGWIFPLGMVGTKGEVASEKKLRVNLGCGALATSSRPAQVNTKKLLRHYADSVREEWQLGQPQHITSALLPMGGAVSRVAGRRWAVLGDTAALVNPLNGEGIDYALESARLLVEALGDAHRNPDGLRYVWPQLLRREYGAAFSLARRLAMLLTMPGLLAALGPVGMRGPLAPAVMNSAARLMGNLVTPEDRDVTARLWLGAGRLSSRVDRLFAADARPLFGSP